MELNKNELQFIVNAIDTHVRLIAATGAAITQKFQDEAKAMPDDPATPAGDNSGDQ